MNGLIHSSLQTLFATANCRYFSNQVQLQQAFKRGSWHRKHTAEAIIDFSNREQLLIESKQLGRPKKEVEPDYAQVIRDSVNLSNKTGQPDTTKLTYAQIPV